MMLVSFASIIIIYIGLLRLEKIFFNTVVQFASDQICSLVIEMIISVTHAEAVSNLFYSQ